MGIGLAFLSKGEKVLRFTNDNGNRKHPKMINSLLITAKFYMHQRNLFHKGKTSLIAYLAEIKNRLITEGQACALEGWLKKFKVWEQLLSCSSHDLVIIDDSLPRT